MEKLPEGFEILSQLIGEQLSSVVFIMDYIQLVFNGPTVSIYSNHTKVVTDNNQSKAWDDQFRNRLCGQIAKIVKDVRLEVEKELRIQFADKSMVIISLHPDDQSGPEAIYCHDFSDGAWTVA